MKIVLFAILVGLAMSHTPILAQTKDSVVQFKVYGNCEQCKARIEKAAKIKGVKKADWNVDSKMLSLVFNPSMVSVETVQNKILSAGHDVENKKATNAAYYQLPGCCQYRKETPGIEKDTLIQQSGKDTANKTFKSKVVKGVVVEETKKGVFKPLSGANVIWLENRAGSLTNTEGIFTMNTFEGGMHLIVSYAGFSPDTILVNNTDGLRIILAANKMLSEVTVTSKLRADYLSSLTPVRTEIITDKELLKAACCNLSESFETNPSVDVTYNDAVTGTKQIQLLGLSGNYTQLTVENLPGPRGIATPWGLNYIAGPWIESIQLSKGVGSVVNGYESIAGQINIQLKQPSEKEKLSVNAYVNDFGKTDFNLLLSKMINKNWSSALLVHDDYFGNKNLDMNHDGFRDLPTGNLFAVLNRWEYINKNGLQFHGGIKWVNDNKIGGQVNFNPSVDKFTTNSYGLGILANREEAYAKIGYIFPQKKYKSIGLQLSATHHQQNSYFGFTQYNATQTNLYSNLIYQSIIGNSNHKFKTGLSLNSDHYNEDFNVTNYKRTETVPGAFFEYTFNNNKKFSAIAGIRADHDNLYGWFATPRLHLRYEPFKGTTLRFGAGRGQRTADIFAENTSVFVSARQVNIIPSFNGGAYGLKPEIAWNEGISMDQKFNLFNRGANLGIDFFRTDFQQQVVVDLENAHQVNFYNLAGKSYSNSFQVEANMEPIKEVDVKLAYRYFDVKTTYDGKLLEKPLISANRAFVNLGYRVKKFRFDYTVSYNGKKRIPNTSALPIPYQLPAYSPGYYVMNAQVTRTFGKKNLFDVYLGSENLTNYFQKTVILSAENPFSNNFDASLVWGPVSGRMFYLGVRYKV